MSIGTSHSMMHPVRDVDLVCVRYPLVSSVVSTTRKRAWLASIRW